MTKLIEINDTRKVIFDSVKQFEDLVCSTMGPHGQNVALRNEAEAPVITKDGVTVAKSINSDNDFEQLIFDILKQAAEKTNSEAGDGTTTATCIAANTFKEGYKLIQADVDPMLIKREIDLFLTHFKELLSDYNVKFKDRSEEEIEAILYKIAMISTNGDVEMSKVISEATAKAGLNGVINIKKTTGEYEITRSTGARIPNAGVVNYEYVKGTVDKKVTLNNCYVLLTTYELENPSILNDLKKVLEGIGKTGGSLLIMSKKVDKGFLANLLQWNATGQLKNVAVRAPYFGSVGREMLDDLAAYLGTVVIEEEKKHSFVNVTAEMLGRVNEADVTPHYTIFKGVRSDETKLAERIRILEEKLKLVKDPATDPDKTLERLSLLNGKVFTISVPSVSDIEDKERMDRVDDAINACKGALEHGFVPGGGITLYRIGLDQAPLIKKILQSPLKKIFSNASKSESIFQDLNKDGYMTAYDLRNDIEGIALEVGVIDPYKVTESAVLNGLSVGSMLLTTKAIVLPKKVESTPFDMGY
jgi:chaperonin GroEL